MWIFCIVCWNSFRLPWAKSARSKKRNVTRNPIPLWGGFLCHHCIPYTANYSCWDSTIGMVKIHSCSHFTTRDSCSCVLQRSSPTTAQEEALCTVDCRGNEMAPRAATSMRFNAKTRNLCSSDMVTIWLDIPIISPILESSKVKCALFRWLSPSFLAGYFNI